MNLTILITVWLILDQSNVIFDQSKITWRVFKNPLAFHMFITFSTFSKAVLSLFNWLRSQFNFLLFSLEFFARFLSSKVDKTFLPLLFHLFSCFMHFGDNFKPMKFWDFCWFKLFLWKLINGFLLWDNIKVIFVI